MVATPIQIKKEENESMADQLIKADFENFLKHYSRTPVLSHQNPMRQTVATGN